MKTVFKINALKGYRPVKDVVEQIAVKYSKKKLELNDMF